MIFNRFKVFKKLEKFERNLKTQFSDSRTQSILALCADQEELEKTSVTDFMSLIVAE